MGSEMCIRDSFIVGEYGVAEAIRASFQPNKGLRCARWRVGPWITKKTSKLEHRAILSWWRAAELCWSRFTGKGHVTVRRYCGNTRGNELPRLSLPFKTRHAYPQHKNGVKAFNLLLSLEERTVHRRHHSAPTKQMDNARRTTAREGEL